MKNKTVIKRRTICIVANGTLPEIFLPEIKKCVYLIGVDKAAYWLIRKGIIPDLAVGDFDSAKEAEFREIASVCPVKKFPPEKDWTDLELGVKEAISRTNMSHIVIYGATGSRFDHALAAVGLLGMIEKAGKYGIIKDVHNEIRLITEKTVFQKNPEFKYISLIPVGASVTVTLTGFRYNAKKLKINRNQTIGVSNEIVEKEAVIIPCRGKVLVIRSRD